MGICHKIFWNWSILFETFGMPYNILYWTCRFSSFMMSNFISLPCILGFNKFNYEINHESLV